MFEKTERNQEIVQRYLAGENSVVLSGAYNVSVTTICLILKKRAPEGERVRVRQFNRRNNKAAQQERENARNRQIEEWLSQGLTYSETARRASNMFWDTSRCAVAGIANRQRRRAAA